MQNKTKDLILAALCLALGLVLPSAFHMVGAGTVFLPMHLPVLLCGMVCGWRYGAAVGLIVPLLSSVLTSMPPLFPVATAMMFELAAYGALCGVLYQVLHWRLYPALLGAMLGGRVVSGLAYTVFMGMASKPYGFSAFLSGAFVTAVPGIVIQLIAIPLLVTALQKSGFIGKPATNASF